MTVKKYLIPALCALFVTCSALSGIVPEKIGKLKRDVSALCYSNLHDSAQALILRYLGENNLSDLEIFYCRFLFADVLKSSGLPEKALHQLTTCRELVKKIPENFWFESLLEGNIAECYFNQLKYDYAKAHALISIRLCPDSSLRDGGHAVNYLIIGYGEYIAGNYPSALKHYQMAYKEYLSHGEKCELPLVYSKMASAYNGLGNHKRAEECINRARHFSDSCNIDTYRLLSMHSMLDIYKQNKLFEKALIQLEEINALVNTMAKQRQDRLISELEVKYKAMLMQTENRNLQEINLKNSEILYRQKLALYITFSAAAVLAVLSVILMRVSIQRKKAERNLTALNRELENRVTERTQRLTEANEKIREDRLLLASQNSQLIDFCNTVSHNLRSPIVNISMLISMVENCETISEQRQILSKLKPVAGSLRETFDELLESLALRQDTEVKSEQVLSEDCLKKVLNGLAGEILNSKAVIKPDFKDAPVIFYPPKYLSSIFHNLVSNALKYRSPEREPVIMIQTKKSGNNIILSVRDNGLGIDLEKYKDKIFKLRKVFHDHPDAKGFGLFITKAQVEAMGGKIWVSSSPGTGSDFFVEFINQHPISSSAP